VAASVGLPHHDSIHTAKTLYFRALAVDFVPDQEAFQRLAIIDLSTGLC
jgi:hypothetical protein